jgi:Zn-dependent protease
LLETLPVSIKRVQANDTIFTRLKPIALFFLSFLAFGIVIWVLTLGSSTFGLLDLGILMGVLLVHETGHFLCMRHFGYRNLRMFFIPLFGAAVSGYSVNVSIVERAFVLLSGPVPGLLLGYGIGLLYLITHVTILRKVTWMLVVLNGANLLPLYPLDGGQFVFELLSGRSARSDTWLQGFLTMLLIGASLWLGWSGMIGVGIGLLFRMRHWSKINRITHRLRKSDGILPDGNVMTASTVLAVTRMVEHELPELSKPRRIAELVATVCRRANAERPREAERLSLLLLYVELFVLLVGTWWFFGTKFVP